jgi:hypothetical protein
MEDIEKARNNLKTFGSQRVNMILGIGKASGKDSAEIELARASRFGLGTKRTLEQAVEFTGIDLAGTKMLSNKCGNLLWVPFEESPNYGVGETLSRGNAGEAVPVFVVPPDDGPALAGGALSRSGLGLRSGARSLANAGATTVGSLQGYQVVGGLLVAGIAVARLIRRPRAKHDMYKK